MSIVVNPEFQDTKHFESSKRCSGCGITETQLRKQTGKSLQCCARCKWTRYCSQKCQKAEWPQHKIKCAANATTASELAERKVHPKLLSDFRAWLPNVVKPIAWTTLNALEAKPKPQELHEKCFLIELKHVPAGKAAKDRFRLLEFDVLPRELAEAAVESDPQVLREFKKTLGERGSTIATCIIKVGELVKVVGFDASPDALETHKHCATWATSGVLEKTVSGEVVLR